MIEPIFRKAETEDEKIVDELIKNLKQFTIYFMNLNKAKLSDEQAFYILYHASIGFVGDIIIRLVHSIDARDKNKFLKICQELFSSYIKQANGK